MMRQVIAGVLALGLACSAQAQDSGWLMPTGLVPGTPTYWNWGGIYVGGQLGMASGNFKPDNATGEMVANILRDTTIENEAHISDLPRLKDVSTTGRSYGGFIGFNQQWEDVILGIEFGYNFGKLSASSSDSIARSYTTSDGYFNQVGLNSQASAVVKDYATLRARAGHIMGRFLPYAHVGGAVARADISRSVTVNLQGTDVTNTPPLPPFSFFGSESESKKNAFLYGITAGAGLDVALTSNIFVRAEYEYVHFFPFKGMTFDIHTGRIGAGVKF
jgi:opacity protein-like surface antigen